MITFCVESQVQTSLALIWSPSRFSSPLPKWFDAFHFLPPPRKCVPEIYLAARWMNPAHLSAALKQSNGEKNIAVFGFAPLVIYGEDPSILLCSAGTSDAGGNSGKRGMETRQRPTPKPHHLPPTNMLVDHECLRLLKYGAPECASTHTYPHLDLHADAHGKQTLL